MLHATARSSFRRASVSLLCGLLLTAVATDAAMASVPAPPGSPSTAAARKATARALAQPSARASLVGSRARASSASCSRRGPNTRYGSTVYCPNYVAGLYVGNYSRIDTVRTTYSWFACQALGGANPRFGSGRNHWWLWTQGDDYGGWGWFPANAIKIGGQDQPIPGVRRCYA